MENNMYKIEQYQSRSISPENPTGGKGMGAKAAPNPEWPARNLGIGCKCAPFIEVEPNTNIVLGEINGSGVITSFWITGEVDRSLILRMNWDNEEIPSVEVPLTDFFLYGFHPVNNINDDNWNLGPDYTVSSSLICVNPNRGLNCFIPMPFYANAKITLENRSSVKKGIYYQINYHLKEHEDKIGYFHAQYRSSKPVRKGEDHVVLLTEGNGQYIGCAMYVGLNRNRNWWGEGEFKFFMDNDEAFPTICTTGLEDYFGGAFNWDIEGKYKCYQTPYMGMPYIYKPDGLYQVQQRFTLYRWHVMDPVRYYENLKVTVQCLGWKMSDDGKNNTDFLFREDDYITVAYYYQDSINKINVPLPSNNEIQAD